MSSLGINNFAEENFVKAMSYWMVATEGKKSNGVMDIAIRTLQDPEGNQEIKVMASSKIREFVKSAKNNPLKQLWWIISGHINQLKAVNYLNQTLPPRNAFEAMSGYTGKSDPEPNLDKINTADSGFRYFMFNFDKTFGVQPPKMTPAERILHKEMSDRIWNSENVQGQSALNKYNEYSNLMKQYFSGANFHFEENDGDKPILEILKDKIGFINDKKDRGIKQLAARVSSHFVTHVGEVEHVHLAGNLVPETVMHEVYLGEHEDGTLLKGKRHDMHPPAIKDATKARKFFWIQTENNPDGPDWKSYLKHRTIDFVNYVFRKFMKFKNVNVGPYGYGVGDKDAIIIKLKKA